MIETKDYEIELVFAVNDIKLHLVIPEKCVDTDDYHRRTFTFSNESDAEQYAEKVHCKVILTDAGIGIVLGGKPILAERKEELDMWGKGGYECRVLDTKGNLVGQDLLAFYEKAYCGEKSSVFATEYTLYEKTDTVIFDPEFGDYEPSLEDERNMMIDVLILNAFKKENLSYDDWEITEIPNKTEEYEMIIMFNKELDKEITFIVFFENGSLDICFTNEETEQLECCNTIQEVLDKQK